MAMLEGLERELQHISDHFDHQRWTITCRMMQLRIARGELEGAHAALRNFCRQPWRTLATMESPLAAVLPSRYAGFLEDAGYDDLQSLHQEDDETLSEIVNVGPTSVAHVRQVIAQVLTGTVYESYFEDELSVDRELCLLFDKEGRMSAGSASILASVEQLTKPETLAEIDSEIARLQEQIEKLKSVRKLLGGKPVASGTRTFNMTDKHRSQADAMFKLLQKAKSPLTPSAIADATGSNFTTIGKIARADSRFRLDGRLIALA